MLPHEWNMTRTAEKLGIERSHLYRKLKQLGIERKKPLLAMRETVEVMRRLLRM